MNARNVEPRPAIDSASMALRFSLAGGLVGLLAALLVRPPGTTAANLVHFVFSCSAAGFVVWMTVLAAVYNRQRGQHLRQHRQDAASDRRRSQPPPPYAERLAHFFSHATRPSSLALRGDHRFQSRMRFWTLSEWRESEPTPPKHPPFAAPHSRCRSRFAGRLRNPTRAVV